MLTLFENDALRIRYAPGHTRTLFVSFTGVLHGMGGIALDEFAGSGRAHHCLFVSDLRRTWYNGTGLAEEICRIVRQKAKALGVRRIITIGNSMGGFGAILFARLLQADTAIAFTPQYSFDSRIVPGETRWSEYRESIATWEFPTALPLRARTRYYLFSGVDRMEMQHTELFPQAPNLALFLVGGGHTVAQAIKDSGCLGRVIRACIGLPMPIARLRVRQLLRPLVAIPVCSVP